MLSHLRVSASTRDLPPACRRRRWRSSATSSGRFGRAACVRRGVATDDLSMQAVADVADQPTAAVLALQAGADLALVGSVDAAGAAHGRVVEALATGELPRGRAAEAATRVLRLKGVDAASIACLVGPTHYTRPG
jgi:beta-N-acetylhexosaminidase